MELLFVVRVQVSNVGQTDAMLTAQAVCDLVAAETYCGDQVQVVQTQGKHSWPVSANTSGFDHERDRSH